MANQTSQHILGTSANLLGFCLFVIMSLYISSESEIQNIDLLTSLVSVFLTVSCILSFISIRTHKRYMDRKLEDLANYFFIISLIGILIIILLITLNFIN
jgi:glucan phosphoethanolaminetransferase (alkaline phosphatase superfamily)